MPTSDSDLTYVRGDGRNERVVPVLEVNMGNWADVSGTIDAPNVAQPLFAQADEKILSRFVENVGETGTLWINFLGGDAEANAPGSVQLKPGAMRTIPTRAPVSIAGDKAGIPFTAGEA